MHPSVGGEPERAHHRRLVLTGLFVPVLMAAALVQTLATHIGGTAILTLVSALIGLAWLTVTLLAASGKARIPEIALLLIATLAAATVVAAAGLSSPLALIGLMPAAEGLWVRRDRSGLTAGLAASAAVYLAQAEIGAIFPLAVRPLRSRRTHRHSAAGISPISASGDDRPAAATTVAAASVAMTSSAISEMRAFPDAASKVTVSQARPMSAETSVRIAVPPIWVASVCTSAAATSTGTNNPVSTNRR